MDPNTNNKHLRIKHQTELRRIPGTASIGVEQGITSLSTASCTQEQSGGTAYSRFTAGRYQVQHLFLDTEKGQRHRLLNIEEERRQLQNCTYNTTQELCSRW